MVKAGKAYRVKGYSPSRCPAYSCQHHVKAGIHPKIVQERLGHSSIQITLDIYSHVAPGLQEAAANRFDDILGIKHNENVAEKY